jgi:GntR family transcriptional repressor for pyruvate dehydrogenase complex
MEARLIVEPELAARAAARGGLEHLASLRQSLVRMAKSGDQHSELIEEDLRFHRTIFQMAANRVCSIMFSIVHQSLHKLMEVTSQMVDLEHTVKLHQRIYNAIRKGDANEARERMFAHLTDAKELLIRSSEAQSQARLGHRLTRLSIQNPPPRRAKQG